MTDERPIGVFDSGVGGLTVLRALHERLPDESYVYLGDTARLPYGTKSPETVVRYARQAARALVEREVKLLVIACNTASATALEVLRSELAPLPVLGVIDPGAEAACAASTSGRIVVIATEGTVRGGAYERAIASRRADARVTARPCPLFVALAEEGWIEGPVPEAVAHAYLDDLLGPAAGVDAGSDCLVLGCTHFPVLADVLRTVVGPGVVIVDSARTTAIAVDRLLEQHRLRAPVMTESAGLEPGVAARTRLLATDDRQRFARVGSQFLGIPLDSSQVDLVDL